jgi:hypothetical protein
MESNGFVIIFGRHIGFQNIQVIIIENWIICFPGYPIYILTDANHISLEIPKPVSDSEISGNSFLIAQIHIS